MTYTPSKADGPNGPRNDKAQLNEIAQRTAEFNGTHDKERFSAVEDDALIDDDPFSPNNAPKLSLVVLMRIYDVGMALLGESNPEAGQRLHDLHAQGKILFSEPFIDLTGDDLTEEQE